MKRTRFSLSLTVVLNSERIIYRSPNDFLPWLEHHDPGVRVHTLRQTQPMVDALLSYFPKDKIKAAFERSPGNELDSGKFASPESSAALAANTFGLFLDHPGELSPVPGTVSLGCRPSR